jgi:hypothetical protein
VHRYTLNVSIERSRIESCLLRRQVFCGADVEVHVHVTNERSGGLWGGFTVI